jgi:hypothetical protein
MPAVWLLISEVYSSTARLAGVRRREGGREGLWLSDIGVSTKSTGLYWNGKNSMKLSKTVRQLAT